jgi:hypothetical protein
VTPAFAFLVLGGALIVAGWTNRDFLDTLLARDREAEGGRVSPPGTKGDLGSFAENVASAALGVVRGGGKRQPRYFVPGHSDHIHVAAPAALLAKIEAEAERRGIRVTSGYRSNSTTYHGKGLARDFGDLGNAEYARTKLAPFARWIAENHGGAIYELFWDGPGWVNIDNG